ncbi:MAG: Cna B-type domain-containing protein [Coriobacteriales bacterium]|jgi:serine-aspartate repeat-containing protein C/D/E
MSRSPKPGATTNIQDGIRPSADEFKSSINLFANEEEVTDTYANNLTVTDNGDGTYTVSYANLPKNANGAAIAYKITEDAIEGYTGETAGNGNITNTHKPGTTSVSITKSWNDNSDQDGIRISAEDFAGKVHLFADGTDVTSQYTANVTDNGDNTYTVSFANLPEKSHGQTIVYKVTEDELDDYSSDQPEGGVENGGTITNTHTPYVTEVSITKFWKDANNQDGIRTSAEDFAGKVHLIANGADVTSQYTASVADNGDGTYTVTYSNLPLRADGQDITYTVKEDVPEGYTSDQPEDGAINGGTITNTHTPDVTEVSITKSWNDEDDKDNLRPSADEFADWVSLYANGTEVKDAAETVTDNDDGTYTVTYTNLPKNAAGKEIAYTVKEAVPDDSGYEADKTEVGNGDTITNTHKPHKVAVADVEKTTDDESDSGTADSDTSDSADTPDTGDASSMLWLALAAAASGIVLVGTRRRSSSSK